MAHCTRGTTISFARTLPTTAFQIFSLPPRLRRRASHPRVTTLHLSPGSTEQNQPKPYVPRRAILRTLALTAAIPLLPTPSIARSKPKEPLSSSLVPLVRVRDSLKDLSADVASGTNGDVRRVIKVVLTGNDVIGSARKSSLWLSNDTAETAERHAREAFEYLNQVVEYFDATATKERPRSEVLKFCQMAIDAAGDELDQTLSLFDQEQVGQARTALGA